MFNLFLNIQLYSLKKKNYSMEGITIIISNKSRQGRNVILLILEL
jgi:hypothetical protein